MADLISRAAVLKGISDLKKSRGTTTARAANVTFSFWCVRTL